MTKFGHGCRVILVSMDWSCLDGRIRILYYTALYKKEKTMLDNTDRVEWYAFLEYIDKALDIYSMYDVAPPYYFWIPTRVYDNLDLLNLKNLFGYKVSTEFIDVRGNYVVKLSKE